MKQCKKTQHTCGGPFCGTRDRIFQLEKSLLREREWRVELEQQLQFEQRKSIVEKP